MKMKTAIKDHYRGQPGVFKYKYALWDTRRHRKKTRGGDAEDKEEDCIDQSSEDEDSAVDSELVIAPKEQIQKNQLETHSFPTGEYDTMRVLAELDKVNQNKKVSL
ncbi:unnamed protein product [Clonostachys rosea]|uniref:Clr5 domain-containing protein n=1 Tax=Bionectria ochroleuca TaxID=29856 RepID=A0ABY6US35_BIOOC|nr:unnamed protein product [Clonostachys rosea]